MRPFVKILVILAVLAALVTGIAIIAVIVLPGSDLLRSEVQDKLRAVTGQEVRLGSIKMSGSFPSLISLTVKDLSVTSNDGRPLLTADTVVLTPELAPLLKREISIESIAIKGLRTSTRRAADGTIINAFIPVPLSSRSVNILPDEGPEADKSGKQDLATASSGGTGLKWSVNSIRLDDCRLDWVDQYVVAGKETYVSLSHLNGFMKREESANSFSLNLTGRIGNQKEAGDPFIVDGVVSLSDDLSGFQHARVSFSSESLTIDPFSPYLPPWAVAIRELRTMAVSSGVEWNKGKSGRISLKTESKGPFQIKVNGDASLAPGFSSLEQVNGACEATGLPIALVKSVASQRLPLDAEKGTVTTALQGKWAGPDAWQLSGSVQLDDVVPVGPLKKIAPSMRVRAKGDINPERLLIEHVELANGATFARLGGEVSAPLTDKRTLNLKGEFTFQPQWLKSFGVQPPKEVQIPGPIPVHGTIKGSPASPSVDLIADISGLRIDWPPYFEKTPGSKGSVEINGKPFAWGESKRSDHPMVTVRLHTVRLGAPPHALTKAGVQMESAILIKANSVDLKDATLRVKRTAEGAEVLQANGSVTNLGATDIRIDGSASVTVDKEALALAGLGSTDVVTLSGSSVLKAKFSGAPSTMNWSLEFPVNNLDMAVQKTFKKPAGVAGLVKASGKWTGDTLDLTEGRLTLPGLALHAHGQIMDRGGKFREATVEVKKLELKEFLRLFPSMSGTGLSGPLEATIYLKNSGGQVLPSGTVYARGVDFRPPNSGLHIEKITGALEPSGTSLVIPELKGKLTGAIEAPLKVNGSLTNFPDLASLNGHIALHGGPGSVKAEVLKKIFEKVEIVGKVLGPLTDQKSADFLELRSLTGDINIKSGTAATDNLKIKGPALAAGAIGSLRLSSSDLDLLAAIQGATSVGTAIGKIPGVPELMKRHEGLLKATGLDKELKRFGIEVPTSDKKNSQPETASKPTPITVILKIRGPMSGPQMVPVLETTMEKNLLTRLKSLLE